MQVSESQTGRAVRTRRWKYGVDAPGETGPSAARYEEQYLYDLQADPYELANVIGSEAHRPVADVMGGRLLRRMTAAGEGVPEIEVASARSAGRHRVSAAEARQ